MTPALIPEITAPKGVSRPFPILSFQPRYEFPGVPGTTIIRIDQALYDACFDPRDYRPKGH